MLRVSVLIKNIFEDIYRGTLLPQQLLSSRALYSLLCSIDLWASLILCKLVIEAQEKGLELVGMKP